MENGVAILWKSYLQLFVKRSCKKHQRMMNMLQEYIEEAEKNTCGKIQTKNRKSLENKILVSILVKVLIKDNYAVI